MNDAYSLSCEVDSDIYEAQVFAKAVTLLLEYDHTEYARTMMGHLEDILERMDSNNGKYVKEICRLERKLNDDLHTGPEAGEHDDKQAEEGDSDAGTGGPGDAGGSL